MTTITNLEELYAEKKRLTRELRIQKEMIHEEVRQIKEHLAPVKKVLTFLGVLHPKENDSSTRAMLKSGANIGIELVGQRVLSKAGWITRFAIPLLAKGLSSKIFDRYRKKST